MLSPTSTELSLTYVLTAEKGTPSFSPEHSDVLLNATFMEQIVGTLIKYGNSGRFEPYLADSWSSSTDKKKWQFRFRAGLKCEDGTDINAHNYISSLKHLLRIYSGETKSLPVFQKLNGFKEFMDGRSSSIGATATSDLTLEFTFDEAPLGILEYLSMPYYGFYCPGDFISGKWKDTTSIISSGAYRLSKWDGKSDIVLLKRNNWFSHVPRSPDTVTVKMLSFDEARQLKPTHTIIARKVQSEEDIPSGFTKVLGTPTDLVSIVLSPFRKSVFHLSEHRKTFRDLIRIEQQKIPFTAQTSTLTRTFYRSQPASNPVAQSSNINLSPLKPLIPGPIRVVISNALTQLERDYVETLIKEALSNLHLIPAFEGEDRTKPNWKQKLDELLEYDIRVARVDIGGSAESWVIRMMFCSRMGVSFPDPSGTICQLTNTFDKSESTINREAYAQLFEQSIVDNAAVIPVFHSAFSWLFSNDIDLKSVSPTSNLPRFDLTVLR